MDTQLHPILSHYIAWLKAHERLVIIAGLIFFGAHFYTKGFDYLAKRDQTQAQIAHDTAQSALQAAETSDQQNKLLQQQLAELKKTTDIRYANLQAQIVKRDQQNEQQKLINDQLSLPDVAKRWEDIVVLPQDAILPSVDRVHLEITEEAAHKTVNQLEDGQTYKLDLQNTQLLLTDSQGLVNRTQQALDSANGEIALGKTALQTEQQSHQSDVKTLKSKNKTAWLHGFKWGAIIGVTGYEAVRIFLAHKP